MKITRGSLVILSKADLPKYRKDMEILLPSKIEILILVDLTWDELKKDFHYKLIKERLGKRYSVVYDGICKNYYIKD